MCAAVALAGTAVSTSTFIAATKTIAMTTLQKTLITATLVMVAGAGIYEARRASILRDQIQTLQQQQAPLTEEIQKLKQGGQDVTARLTMLTAENERLKGNAAELLKLRGETATLRSRLAAKETEYEKLAAESVRGQFLPRTDWADKGNQSPFAAVETMLWASSEGQRARLAEVVAFEVTDESLRRFSPSEQPPGVTVSAVNIIQGIGNKEGTRSIVTAMVRREHTAPPGGGPYSDNDIQSWRLIKTDGGWKISENLFLEIDQN